MINVVSINNVILEIIKFTFTFLGYGNIAPQTTNGRIFCILFALIGIPFTLTVIADLGMLMASAVAAVYRNVRKRSDWTRSQAAQTFGRKYGKSLSVVLVVVLLIVYIAIGGGIFMIWEDWNFLGNARDAKTSTAFYFFTIFCVISLFSPSVLMRVL